MKHEGVPVAPDVRERLNDFMALLMRWNRTVNLVSPGDVGLLWSRHVEDSLQLARAVPADVTHVIDLGSGGGFPGLVIAIASGIPVDLVEADRRKASFLREAARLTGAPARVHAVRAEIAELAPAPIVTARAFAPLARLLPLACRLLQPRGICLFPKGRNVERELTEAARQWHMGVERLPSLTDAHATILKLSEIHPIVACQ